MKRYLVPLWLAATATSAFAQEGPRSITLPNEMNFHTWFIIGSAGAFLAWCLSYAIQAHKEAIERQQKGRGNLVEQKEALLNRIAEIESRKEAATITEQRYKHEMRELRFRLAKVLEKIANPEAQQSS